MLWFRPQLFLLLVSTVSVTGMFLTKLSAECMSFLWVRNVYIYTRDVWLTVENAATLLAALRSEEVKLHWQISNYTYIFNKPTKIMFEEPHDYFRLINDIKNINWIQLYWNTVHCTQDSSWLILDTRTHRRARAQTHTYTNSWFTTQDSTFNECNHCLTDGRQNSTILLCYSKCAVIIIIRLVQFKRQEWHNGTF